jgi:hypothetical protein
MPPTLGEICSSCKLRNKPGAILCEFCGAKLQGAQQETRRTDRFEPEDLPPDVKPVGYIQGSLVPDSGLGIYLENTTPVMIMRDDEATLGRKAGGTGGLIVDLVPFGAIQLGVSRAHAVIRRVRNGYEIMDLGSTNGTWVNSQKLEPDEPRAISSGDMIRLGRLSLLVLYKK